MSPFLYLVSAADLRGPLSQFQATAYDTIGDDVLNLVFSVNQKLPPDLRGSQEVLRDTFTQWWPHLCNSITDTHVKAEQETRSGYSWLLTLQEIVQIPSQYKYEHIFIVARDLWQHTMEVHCQKFLVTSLENKVRFDFIFSSQNTRNDEAQNRIMGMFNNYREQLRFFPIDDVDFKRQAVTKYVIMNPESQSDDQVAFIEVPCADSDRWIKVDDQAAAGFAARLNDLRESEMAKQKP